MATLYVDNKPYTFEPGKSLLDVCLSLGFNVPYFCWHPTLHSVGACRQCEVKLFKDADDAQGKIVMSCMTRAKDGMRISIDDPEAVELRAKVIEWLMVNHPHDCPVCDEGGECHLQDMTVMTGHNYRRYRFAKRTYNNQNLGPFVNHEMNRCIQCYRCVRFYRDYAGGKDLDVFGWHDDVYFGRHEDGKLENEFSGNLVEVCPTGVFTDKTFKKHYTRKWDLQTAPSVCVHCGLGCNTIPGERYGQLRRVYARYNEQVNSYWLCDRGRYGYEFVNSDKRIRQPMLRRDGTLAPATRPEAMEQVGRMLAQGTAMGIGSARASLEANYALRTLVGAENFFAGVSERQHRLLHKVLGLYRGGTIEPTSIYETEQCDSVLVLGEDVTSSAPRLALALRQCAIRGPAAKAARRGIKFWEDQSIRQAIQEEKGPFFIAHPHRTKLDDVATAVSHSAPDDLARLGFAIAHAIDAAAPAVEGLDDALAGFARQAAEGLIAGERPLLVAGVSLGSERLLDAAVQIATALRKSGKPCRVAFVVPECNSLALAMFEAASLESALKAAQERKADTLVVLENDLYQCAERGLVEALLSAVRQVIVLDSVWTATAERAQAVLPAGTFAESDGTFVNNEARAQRFLQVFLPQGEIKESWRWLCDMALAGGRRKLASWRTLDMLLGELAETLPALRGAKDAAPPESFRMVGGKIPRQGHRYSGRTAITADVDVHEPATPEDRDSPMAFSMEGYEGLPPPALIARYWSPGWNSVQAINKFQIEVEGQLRGGTPGVRLFGSVAAKPGDYLREIPPAFSPRTHELLVLPVQHIFGSDPLSMLSPSIAECAPRPYVAVSVATAKQLHLQEGQMVTLRVGEQSSSLPVQVWAELPAGTAAVPAGRPGAPVVDGPTWGRIDQAAGKEARP